MQSPALIVGHLAPDLDCIVAIWILVRFASAQHAELAFVPAGTTLQGLPPDTNPQIIHVDTGGGRFDHHHTSDPTLSAAELVRRSAAPNDPVLERLVQQVTRLDHSQVAGGEQSLFFSINSLIAGYNGLFPNRPQHVAEAMFPNLDAWYEHEARQVRLEQAFANRFEFETPWGLGIAMESGDGGSSRLAYQYGAVLYAYRDRQGYMGVAAQSRSRVDLSPVYSDLRQVDAGADWYLHPSKRLLLCGTPKAPPRNPSQLSLVELIELLRSDDLFARERDDELFAADHRNLRKSSSSHRSVPVRKGARRH